MRMAAPTQTPEELQQQRKREYAAARNTYIIIIASFLTICTIAVIVTSRMEAEKQGFRPIQTEAPMSFIDKTYVVPKKTP